MSCPGHHGPSLDQTWLVKFAKESSPRLCPRRLLLVGRQSGQRAGKSIPEDARAGRPGDGGREGQGHGLSPGSGSPVLWGGAASFLNKT